MVNYTFKPFKDVTRKIVEYDFDVNAISNAVNDYYSTPSISITTDNTSNNTQWLVTQFQELTFNYEQDCAASISNPIEVKTESSSFPKMDIYKEDNTVYIVLAVAGYSKKEILMKATDDMLFIAGVKEKEKEKPDREYIQHQLAYRKWKKIIKLGSIVDVDNIKAKFENGLLIIQLPLKEEHKSKIIEIE